MTTRDVPSWVADVDDLAADLRGRVGAVPYDPTPDRLYRADDLYQGLAEGGFAGCLDQQIYRRARHSGGPRIGTVEELVQRLHDHGITVALDRFREGRRLVGIMGGHAVLRGTSSFHQGVQLGRALAQAGYCVTSGGGPGAMEAANLGAATSLLDMSAVDRFVARLAEVPSFSDDPDRFASVALEVWHDIEQPVVSLAVPTWFYGHEPSNPFATHIAKYFSNSEREDGLLAIAASGIVFLRGGPGTLQEVFQDAAQNAYRTYGPSAPMVFLDPPDEPTWWRDAGVLAALDQAFTDGSGQRRAGWELVANVASVDAVLQALTS